MPRWRMLLQHAFGIVLFVSISTFSALFGFTFSDCCNTRLCFNRHAWWLPKNGRQRLDGRAEEKNITNCAAGNANDLLGRKCVLL
jgi:hypothetical protein